MLLNPYHTEILEHIKSEYPKEIIGYVADGAYVPLDNVSTDPENRFELIPQDQLKIYKAKGIIVHSHNDSVAVPSEEDILIKKQSRLQSFVVATDGSVILAVREVL